LWLVAGGPRGPSGPADAAARGAQFAADAVREPIRTYLAAGVAPRIILGELRQVFIVDSVLVPIGLLTAIAAAPAPATALLVLPLVYLLAHFAREREARIGQSIEMTRSFRGTDRKSTRLNSSHC